MTTSIGGTIGVTFPDGSIQATAATGFGFKNRIINGSMVLDQRSAGASVSVGTATGTYTLDRWRVYHDTAITSNITAQQSTTVPSTGYINSQVLTNGTTATAAAGDVNVIQQRIEGLNVADLNFGAATAANVTLSFWIRSSLTGTFGIALSNSAQDRSYVSTYVINTANTWEQKTVTVAGDQAGTWLTTNGIGLIASWDLGSGTSLETTAGAWQAGQYFRTSACASFINSTGATFYITGVQLEKGLTATSFDVRSYGTELALAQRYYYKISAVDNDTIFGPGLVDSTTEVLVYTPFQVYMRTYPTALTPGGTAGAYRIRSAGAVNTTCSVVPTFIGASNSQAWTTFTVASGLTAGQACFARATTTAASLAWSAEL